MPLKFCGLDSPNPDDALLALSSEYLANPAGWAEMLAEGCLDRGQFQPATRSLSSSKVAFQGAKGASEDGINFEQQIKLLLTYTPRWKYLIKKEPRGLKEGSDAIPCNRPHTSSPVLLLTLMIRTYCTHKLNHSSCYKLFEHLPYVLLLLLLNIHIEL